MNLNIGGQGVARICFDAALTVLTSGDCELCIETESVLRVSTGDLVPFDPEFPDVAASHLVRLARDVIVDARVGRSGDLVVEFESGAKLTVRPDEEYEAWGFVGPEGRRVTCLPRGEIAVWSGE